MAHAALSEAELLSVSRRLADSLSLEVLLPRLAEIVGAYLHAERASIFLHDARTDELYALADGGGFVRGPAGEGLVGACFRSGEPVLVEGAAAGAASVLCAPLRHGGDADGCVVGVVEATGARGGRFSADDVRLVDALSGPAAAALANAMLYEDVKRSRAAAGRSVRSVQSLLEVSKALAAEVDLDSLLEVILRKAGEVMGAERSSFFVYEEETATLLVSSVSTGLGPGQVRIPMGVGIAGHVAETLRTLNIADAYADPRFNPQVDRETSFRTRSLLCAPVATRGGRLIGVVQVLNKRSGGPFTDEDASLLEAFASHAAIAVERARLVEAFVEKEKIEETLRLAHEIQMGMLPHAFPRREEYELVAQLRPARSVGGDLYDFLEEGDRLWFMVGDVSGKGVGAALFMAVTKTLFRACVVGETRPDAVLGRMNRELARDNERAMFVTVFLGCLDARTGGVDYCNAGHNLPYRLSPGGGVQALGQPGGMALGVLEDAPQPAGSARLEPGEALFVYSDGVTEAMSPGGVQYSEARLEAYLRATSGQDGAEVVAGTFASVGAFEAGGPPSDDVTVMWLRFRGHQPLTR